MFVPAWPSPQLQPSLYSQRFMSFVYLTEVRFCVPNISVEQQSFSVLQNQGCSHGASALRL